MLRLIASTMVLAAALTGIARAADTDDWLGDVRQLLPACKAAEYPDQIHSLLIAFKAGACMGLVDGLLIMLRSHNLVCPPDSVDYDQAMRVVIAYVEAHPTELQNGTRALAVQALRDAWPCKR